MPSLSRGRLPAAVTLAIVVLATGGAISAPSSAFPGIGLDSQVTSAQGGIAYLRGRDIYVMNSDGSEKRNLTPTPTKKEGVPHWSPDGRMIAYSSSMRGINSGMYVVHADGGALRQLAAQYALGLSWSPDGQRILFEGCCVAPFDSQIYVVNADRTGERTLSRKGDVDSGPAWSPDGRKVAFTRWLEKERGKPSDVYVMDADGRGQRRLTRNLSAELVSWSPDGRRILFANDVTGNAEIFVVNPDGSKLRNLTRHSASDVSPVWSPDGRSIAFTSYCDGNWEIYRMNSDGTDQRNLTRQPAKQRSPSWSPDGQQIAYVNFVNKASDTKTRHGEIYVMNADGTGQRNLTPAGGRSNHDSPAWSPR